MFHSLIALFFLSFSFIGHAEEMTVNNGLQLQSLLRKNFQSNDNCIAKGEIVRTGGTLDLKLDLFKKTDYTEKSFMLKNFSNKNIKSVYSSSTLTNTYTYEITENFANNPLNKRHFVISLIGNKTGKLIIASVRKERTILRLGRGAQRTITETIFNCSI